MVVIWVNDGLVCSNKSNSISDLIKYLGKHVEMRSSEAKHFVGLSITRVRKERMLYVSQLDYTRKTLQWFCMDECH